MIKLDEIRSFFRGYIGLNESLSRYTSFRIGGPADCYLEPADKDDAFEIVRHFQEHGVTFVIMGKGTNLLVSDDGLRNPVINLEMGLNGLVADTRSIRVEAGVRMSRFVDFCIQQAKKGVEMLAGIPGTMGGAVVMNAGAYGGEISDYLTEVEIIRDGAMRTVQKSDAGFSYRRSGFQRDVVLGASFDLPDGDKADLLRRRRELLIKRNDSQPLNLPNSGSVFKNPAGDHAARLIEAAGLKGARRGGAQISEKHANFIVNHGDATAMNVFELMKLARSSVKTKFGIALEPEVKLIGFPEEIRKELSV